MQNSKFRSCCCPRIVVKLQRKFVFYIVPAGLIGYLSESSKITKWRYLLSSVGRPRRSFKIQTQKIKMRSTIKQQGDRLRDHLEWLEEFTDNLEDTEVPAVANTSHDSDPERLYKWHQGSTVFIFSPRETTIARSGSEPRLQGLLAQGELVIPEGPKLRHLHEDKITWAPCRKRWHSHTSGKEIWRLENSRSKCPQWRMWISNKSSTPSRGTRFGHSMDSILSVQDNKSSGNRKELTKVLGVDQETKSHLHWQFLGIWPQTQDWIWVDMYLCFRPPHCLIMTQSKFHPRRDSVYHRGYIQDLEWLFHEQS